jgi:hypothetical protein
MNLKTDRRYAPGRWLVLPVESGGVRTGEWVVLSPSHVPGDLSENPPIFPSHEEALKYAWDTVDAARGRVASRKRLSLAA